MGNNYNIPLLNMKSMFMVVLTVSLALASSANAYNIAVVWGQGGVAEGTLKEACTNGSKYSLVKISYLTNFGNDRTPHLNLSTHCDPFSEDHCTSIVSDGIKACQALGIKVLLSMSEDSGDWESFSSADDARDFATYLWNNYLAGSNSSGPLGSNIPDGIDIELDKGSNQYFDDFVMALAEYEAKQRLYLSATPHCSYPDSFLGDVIATGLLDYVFVKFYNDESCEYDVDSGDVINLLDAWGKWQNVSAGEVVMALPAAANATDGGFVPPEVLIMEVLPVIKQSPLYGGVMLWNRLFDVLTNYSSAIDCCV